MQSRFSPFPASFPPGSPGPRLNSIAGDALERLLSVREVAAQLGLSTATVYKLCEQGQLAHLRMNGALRVRPADLRAFIAEAAKRGGRR